MYAALFYVILIAANCLQAASMEPHLFMCYMPTYDPQISIQSHHDRDTKTLCYILTDLHTYRQSDKVTFCGNWVHPTSDFNTHMKLSLVASGQYPDSTINGRFLALSYSPRYLVSLSAIILDKRLNEHVLPVYRDPVSKEVRTQVEYDAIYPPKTAIARKSC